jgi:DNA polymerase I-like protein with 3'-5' exonuclease and polymerase domains
LLIFDEIKKFCKLFVSFMEIYYQLVKDENSLLQACKLFSSAEYVGLDTETTELDPYQGNLRLLQLSDGKETRIVDLNCFGEKFDDSTKKNASLRNDERLTPLRDLLRSSKPIKVIHNAKFDAKWIYHCLGVEIGGIFDTYLASQLLWFGDQDRKHGLADVASHFLNINMDKREQTSDWSAPELTDSQLRYAAYDSIVAWQLYEKLNKKLEDRDLAEVAKIEFECVMPIVAMEINGFYLNSSAWAKRLEDLEEVSQKILEDIGASRQTQVSFFGGLTQYIELDSSEKILGFLRENGVPIGSGSELSLLELQSLAKDYPVAEKVLDYLAASDTLSSLGKEFLKVTRDNRIYPDFRQITSPFARIGCRNLKLHKLIGNKHYSYHFSVPESRSLIVLDYPLLEVAVMAHLSEEEKFAELLEKASEPSDFYKAMALELFGSSSEALAVEFLHHAIVYGIGVSYFARINRINQSEAEDLMELYFRAFPKLSSWLMKISDFVNEKEEIRSAFGRVYRFRFDQRIESQKLGAIRMARTFAIQATLTDILKMTLANLYYGLRGTSAKLVSFVRDQIWIECDQEDKEAVSTKVREIARRTLRNKLIESKALVRVQVFDSSAKI